MEDLKEEKPDEAPKIEIKLEDIVNDKNGNLIVDWEMFVLSECLNHNLYNTAVERLVVREILTASPDGVYTLIGEHLNLSLLMMDERDLSKKTRFILQKKSMRKHMRVPLSQITLTAFI